MTLEQEIGNRVARLRRHRELSQSELGRKIGAHLGKKEWHRQTVYDAERGGRAFVAAEMVALADVLGVPVEYLFGSDLADLPCDTCSDRPPNGFTCNECGAIGQREAS